MHGIAIRAGGARKAPRRTMLLGILLNPGVCALHSCACHNEPRADGHRSEDSWPSGGTTTGRAAETERAGASAERPDVARRDAAAAENGAVTENQQLEACAMRAADDCTPMIDDPATHAACLQRILGECTRNR